VAFDVPARQETGFSGNLLKAAQPGKYLATVPPHLRVFRDCVLLPDPGQVSPRPDAGMDYVARLIDGMLQTDTGRRHRHDGNIEPFRQVVLLQVPLKVLCFHIQRAGIRNRLRFRGERRHTDESHRETFHIEGILSTGALAQALSPAPGQAKAPILPLSRRWLTCPLETRTVLARFSFSLS
jgi:hypothetical protein